MFRKKNFDIKNYLVKKKERKIIILDSKFNFSTIK